MSRDIALHGAESKDLKGVYPTQTVRTLSTTEARTWRTRDGFSRGRKPYVQQGESCSRLGWSKSSEPHRLDKHPRGPSRMFILHLPFAPFQSPKPAPGGPTTVFPRGREHYVPQGGSCSRAWVAESSEPHRLDKHLRGPSTARHKRYVTQQICEALRSG